MENYTFMLVIIDSIFQIFILICVIKNNHQLAYQNMWYILSGDISHIYNICQLTNCSVARDTFIVKLLLYCVVWIYIKWLFLVL